jgi:uncharacterized protein DUF2834
MVGRFYFLAMVAGTLLPLSQFLPWLSTHGLAPALFFEELFANRISAFFGLDVIISAFALIPFVLVEGRRIGMRSLWTPIIGTCLIGVSCGLPMFLYMREARLEAMKGTAVDKTV